MSIIKSLDETSSSATKAGQDYISASRKYYELKVFQMVSLLSSYLVKIALFGSLFLLGLKLIDKSIIQKLSKTYFDS